MVWNGIIAGYLFLAGVGAGSFAFAAMAGWKDPEARKLKMAGMIIGFLCVAVGTLMWVVDAKAGLHELQLRHGVGHGYLERVFAGGVCGDRAFVEDEIHAEVA